MHVAGRQRLTCVLNFIKKQHCKYNNYCNANRLNQNLLNYRINRMECAED